MRNNSQLNEAVHPWMPDQQLISCHFHCQQNTFHIIHDPILRQMSQNLRPETNCALSITINTNFGFLFNWNLFFQISLLVRPGPPKVYQGTLRDCWWHYLQARCLFCQSTNSVKALKNESALSIRSNWAKTEIQLSQIYWQHFILREISAL